MTGLVLEGGTFRGVFSAGFMDALIEQNIEFPYVIGVSAGISNAASYISKQFGLKNTAMINAISEWAITENAEAASDLILSTMRCPIPLCPLIMTPFISIRANSW